MKTRLITSAVGLVLLFTVMAFYETVFFNIVITGICLIAIYEIFKAFHFEKSGYLLWGFIPYATFIMFSSFRPIRYFILPVSYIFAMFLAIIIIRNSSIINFAKLSGMIVFSGAVIFCFFPFIYLKNLFPMAQYSYDAVYFMFLILGFAWGGDTSAYFAGRFFGKRKLAPIVSPNKTVEGAIGGVIGSMIVGVLITFVYSLAQTRLVGIPFNSLGIVYYLVIAFLGAIASVLGILGDLFASAVKRQCDIKDYGTLFPGHGGVLDRFDSVMFIAPFVSMVVTVVFYTFK